jgi:hypothetical protein
MYSVCHNYLLLFQMLATGFGLNRPSHHQANIYKNLKMPVHIIQLINIMGSYSQLLLCFIYDTSYSCVVELHIVRTVQVLLECWKIAT